MSHDWSGDPGRKPASERQRPSGISEIYHEPGDRYEPDWIREIPREQGEEILANVQREFPEAWGRPGHGPQIERLQARVAALENRLAWITWSQVTGLCVLICVLAAIIALRLAG